MSLVRKRVTLECRTTVIFLDKKSVNTILLIKLTNPAGLYKEICMKHSFPRFLSVILIFSLFINTLTTVPVFAEKNGKDENALASESDDDAELFFDNRTKTHESEITAEVAGLRDRCQKTFVLDDGTFLCAVYPDSVHYKNGDSWEDIDNSLVLTRDEKSGKEVYKNASNEIKVTLPEVLTKDTEITYGFGKSGIGFKPLGMSYIQETESEQNVSPSSVKAEVDNDVSKSGAAMETSGRLKKILDLKTISKAKYENVFPGIDLIYSVSSSTLKETMVLNEAPGSDLSFSFLLIGEGLSFIRNDNGSISAYASDGEEAFVLAEPFAYDSDGETTRDIETSLDITEAGNVLTYKIHKEWFLEEERVYPIYIDPSVQTSQIRNNIRDMTVASGGGTDYNDDFIEAGYHRNRGIERTYIKFKTLPSLTSADVVVNAQLYLCRNITANEELQINAHKVNSTWESETLTWSNKPSYSAKITDYSRVKDTGWYSFGITELVRDWYKSANTGVMLKAPDAVESAATHNNRTFISSDYSDSDYRPILTMQYINNCGMESFWDYDYYDAGRAGEVCVNLFTGNLVVNRSDMSFAGNRMPVSIDFVYNMNDKRLVENGSVKAGGAFGLGNGWRTVYNQRVYHFVPGSGVSTGSTDYYIWEDEDGTRHYFYNTDSSLTTYKDESGIDLTLTTNGSGNQKYRLTDKDGNISYFDTSGRLKKIENNQTTKSSVTINHATSGNVYRITSIYDGAGRAYRFNYSSTTGNISSVCFMGTGNTAIDTVSYTVHENGSLNFVTYSDGKRAMYNYSSYCMTYAHDDCKNRMGFSYDTNSYTAPNRLVSIKTYENGEGSDYTQNTYTYRDGYTIASDNNGNKLEYQFNSYGNTVSVQDGQGCALYNKYASDISNTGKKNQLKQASKLQSTANNLLKNTSFERNTFWVPEAEDGALGTYEYSSEEHYIGQKSYKLQKTDNTGSLNVHAGSFGSSNMQAGKSYTFSAYLKTDSIADTGDGACLCVRINNNWYYSERLHGTNDWERYEITFTVPDNIYYYYFYIKLFSAGTVYADCAQLEKNELSSRYNLVENGDFRYGTDSEQGAYDWNKGTYCATSEQRTSLSVGLSGIPGFDSHAYKISGSPDASKKVFQDIIATGTAGDVYSFGGWANGNSAPIKTGNHSNNIIFAIAFRFYYTDNTTSDYPADFNKDLFEENTWQYASGRAVAAKAYNKIRIMLVYQNNVNDVYFDGISIYKDEFGSSYIYDNDGNVTSVTDSRKRKTTYQYSSNNLTKAIMPDGAQYTYTYDTHHNVLTATSAENIKAEFTYDTYGNNTRVRLVNPTGSSAPVIEASASYSSNGNLMQTETGATGLITTYNYNQQTGLLESVQTPQLKIRYTYDTLRRLTGVNAGPTASNDPDDDVAKVTYAYNNDLLSSIVSGTDVLTSYGFAYNNKRLLSSVSAGSSTLSSKSYAGASGYYNQTYDAYGNGGTVAYGYDDLGILTSKTFDGDNNDNTSFSYDNEGRPSGAVDNKNGISTRYLYDISGRPVLAAESGSRNTKTTWSYDQNDNVSGISAKIENETFTENFTYDTDNRLTSSSAGLSSKNITYDAYGRLSGATIKHNGQTLITESIGYLTTSGKTTMLPSSFESTFGQTTKGYHYEYNADGKITKIKDENDNELISYEYDILGRLLSESIDGGDREILYTYDSNGNIISRKTYEHVYRNNEDDLSQEITYTYSTSSVQGGWSDLLLSETIQYYSNGIPDISETITYTNDDIGNRLSDGSFTYTWEHGRRLSVMSNDDETLSFTYDAGGMRLSKRYQAAGTDETTGYYYMGGLLTCVTKGNDRLHFFYDGGGTPVSFDYNGSIYYYLRNAQGDITGIIDSSGTQVVSYSYNTWGVITGITGTAAQTVGRLNPLRYRGYVYDDETGLYYVSSRYYDPELGRWISPEPNVDYGEFDEGAGLLGYNVYAYCANNPVMFKDETGESITLACVLIGAGIGLIVGAVGGSHYAKHKKNLTPSDGWDYWKYVVGFGVAGGAVGALVGWGAGALIAKYGVATAATSITKGGGARFSSFNALKRSLGSAGKGKQWHHIVEQCQIGKSGFSKYWIQNSNNVINISNSVHSKVSAYYNSVHRFTNGMRFRDWLSGQSFKTQYEWGIKVLRMYGVKI